MICAVEQSLARHDDELCQQDSKELAISILSEKYFKMLENGEQVTVCKVDYNIEDDVIDNMIDSFELIEMDLKTGSHSFIDELKIKTDELATVIATIKFEKQPNSDILYEI